MNATKPLLFLALLISFRSLAQDSLPSATHALRIGNLPNEGVSLAKNWKFQICDRNDSFDIVKSYDENIKLETQEGKGSEFIIQLSAA